jgi:hypothetical protein
MKKLIVILLVSSGLFSACDNAPSTANVSKVTNYPIITVLGDDPLYIPKGSTFTDPGAIALAGTEEIPYETTAVGNYRGGTSVDTNVTDEYIVTYAATNADGFKGKATRKVIVYNTGDLVTSLEGVYKCNVSRNGSSPSTAQNIKYVYIWKNTDGTYELSDTFGGWYQYHRGFGIGYITPGGVINAVNIPANSFTFPGNPQSNSGFGGTANITGVTVNPATHKVIVTSTWSISPSFYTFIATLTQEQL